MIKNNFDRFVILVYIIIFIILLLLIIIYISFYFIYAFKKDNIGSKWISQINENSSISDLIIPGTHDSATYLLNGFYVPFGKTNNLNILEQLEAGIRFLDIRCTYKDNKFILCHSFLMFSGTLDQVIQNCYSFLQNEKDEFIIMSIKEDYTNDSNFDNAMDSYILSIQESMNNIFYLENKLPKIKDVKGKIILFSRYSTSLGFQTSNWKDNSTSIVSPFIKVQDEYKNNNSKKIEKIKEFNNDDFAGLKLNYTNIQANFLSIFQNAKLINSYLKEITFNPSIIVFDYPTSDNIKKIIEFNFKTN